MVAQTGQSRSNGLTDPALETEVGGPAEPALRNLSRNLERINGCGRVIDWLSVDPDGLSVESPPDGLSIVSPPDGLSMPYRLFIKYWFRIDYWFHIDSVLSPPAPEQRLLPEYIVR